MSSLANSLRASRRRTDSGVYRVSQAQGLTIFPSTKRILGLWVPASAFRRGTVIRFRGVLDLAGHQAVDGLAISIGGSAHAANLGVSTTWETRGLDKDVGFDLRVTQRNDGIVATFDSSGFFSGLISIAVTTGSFTPFIQPLNYVEVRGAGLPPPDAKDFPVVGCVLEVYAPPYVQRQHEEMGDV